MRLFSLEREGVVLVCWHVRAVPPCSVPELSAVPWGDLELKTIHSIASACSCSCGAMSFFVKYVWRGPLRHWREKKIERRAARLPQPLCPPHEQVQAQGPIIAASSFAPVEGSDTVMAGSTMAVQLQTTK